MTKFAHAILVIAISSTLGIAGKAGDTPQTTLNFTIYSCAEALSQMPTISVSDKDTISTQPAPNTVITKRSLGVYEARMMSAKTHFWVNIRVAHCGTQLAVTVVRGHSRHFLAFPNRRMQIIDAHHWIAGELPSGVGKVMLWTKSSRILTAATIDDGCYYFEAIPPGDLVMRFQAQLGQFVEVPVSFVGDDETGKMINFNTGDLVKALVNSKIDSHLPSPGPKLTP